MAGDDVTSATHSNSNTRQNLRSPDESEAELVAYYDEQLKRNRSDEWTACLNATIRQLRHR